MIFFKCDQCDAESGNVAPIELRGYFPKGVGDMRCNEAGEFVALAENLQEVHFCSRECFLKWMRWAMNKEAGVTSVITAVKEPRHPY